NVEAMILIAKFGVELTAKERKLLSVGYKNVLGAKRASGEILAAIKSKKEAKAPVFYHKMKGDYYRYLAEFKAHAEREEATSQSLKAYEASNIAKQAYEDAAATWQPRCKVFPGKFYDKEADWGQSYSLDVRYFKR
ncbi:14-3-3 protein 7, partial [Tanacetum coccineum]